MITEENKKIVESIWGSFVEAGNADDLSIIEQSVLFIFIHELDEKEFSTERSEKLTGNNGNHIFASDQQKFRWHIFINLPESELFNLMKNEIFPFIRNLQNTDFSSLLFFLKKADLVLQKPGSLKTILTHFNQLFINLKNSTDSGMDDVFDYFLSRMKIDTTNPLGLYPTPKHVRDMMVALIQPTITEQGILNTICDPSCGTGGFLVSVAEYIRNNYGSKMGKKEWGHYEKGFLTGYDVVEKMAIISTMNLRLHSILNPTIICQDSISKANNIDSEFDYIFANPPFNAKVNTATLSESLKNECSGSKAYLFFVALFIRMLKKGGQCACIVPDGLLFGAKGGDREIRKTLIEKHQLNAVIHLPKETSGSGTSTAILIFTKTGAGGTDKVWFYDIENDGFSHDDKRIPIEENDIPDVIQRYNNLDTEETRTREDKSFFVPVSEIIENNYDLSINKYKKIKYEKIEYPAPKTIIAEIKELYRQIGDDIKEIESEL